MADSDSHYGVITYKAALDFQYVLILVLIFLGKKPIIFEENETLDRKKDIKYLFDNGLIQLIKNKKIVCKEKKINLNIIKSLKNIINIIK